MADVEARVKAVFQREVVRVQRDGRWPEMEWRLQDLCDEVLRELEAS